MMVSPVSFRAADASAWNSLLEKKQTFQNPTEQPAAASGLSEGGKKKGGVGKKILGVVTAAAVAVGALVLGHKKNIFGSEKIPAALKKIAGYADDAGKWLSEKGAALLAKLPKKAG